MRPARSLARPLAGSLAPPVVDPDAARLPRVLALDAAATDAYWQRLGAAGLRHPYGPPHPVHGQLESHYGTAVDIAPALADQLVAAVLAVDRLVKRYIREAGGLTAWMRDRAPTFGGVPLNFPAVNRRLERLLLGPAAEQIVLPLSFDVILTVCAGAPKFRVVELQSGFGYAQILWHQLAALGLDPTSPLCWRGRSAPRDVLATVRRTLAGGQDISLLATFPSLSQDLPDEAGWASLLSGDGRPRGYFLATDLERDAEGWYHLEVEVDPDSGLPALDADDRPIRRHTPRKRRIRHVVTNQNQLELDHIHARLTPERRARFLEFLADAEHVQWIFPHAGWYIADKGLMGRLGADLRAEGDPIADFFVPCFAAGEPIDVPGTYVQKPIRSAGGLGVSEIAVTTHTSVTVPAGFVAQQRFAPYPFPLRLASGLAGAFPVPDHAPGGAAFRSDPRTTTTTIELRAFSLPGSTAAADAYLFMARVAPTWDPAEAAPTAIVMTNLSEIQKALWNSPLVDRSNYKLAPFGWAVVTIGASDTP